MYSINIPFFNSNVKSSQSTELNYPFNFYYDNDLKIFRQISNERLIKKLNDSYNIGSFIEGSVSKPTGQIYLEPFLKFLNTHAQNFTDKKILEIGFGNGNILSILENYNCELYGIEPGSNDFKSKKTKTFKDFYPSDKIQVKNFDLIYSFGVLEHMIDPIKFINDQLEDLNECEGTIICAIPNCQSYYDSSDISMFFHEHFSYFNYNGIISLVDKSNGYLKQVEEIFGMYFIAISNKPQKINTLKTKSKFSENLFWKSHRAKLNELKEIVKSYEENELAIYVPQRAINIFSLIDKNSFRLVDDNNELINTKIVFFKNKIESFSDIEKNPPKIILIFSNTYRDQIEMKIKSSKYLNGCKVIHFS